MFILLAFLLVSFAPQIQAQRPVAKINVNLEKFTQQEIRDKLINFQGKLEQYINNYEWTDNEHRYNIPVQIDILFERARPTSFEDRYDARFIISNGTDFQDSDKRWTFAYQEGESLTHTGQFHSLTGMLDFFIYILLGHELDKLAKLGGTPYYQKAEEVVQLSKFSEFFQTGWKERSVRIADIISEDRVPLRQLEYFFIQATQWMRLDNRKTANQYLKVILIKLKDLNMESEGLSRFFQIHHLELARMLSVLGMAEELNELKRLDPANVGTYQQFLEQIQ